MRIPSVSEIRKALTALGAGVAVMITAGLITGQTAVWISTGIGALGIALSVYAGPKNEPKKVRHKEVSHDRPTI
jgi:hypothetical protein